jgi:hypothetical protein
LSLLLSSSPLQWVVNAFFDAFFDEFLMRFSMRFSMSFWCVFRCVFRCVLISFRWVLRWVFWWLIRLTLNNFRWAFYEFFSLPQTHNGRITQTTFNCAEWVWYFRSDNNPIIFNDLLRKSANLLFHKIHLTSTSAFVLNCISMWTQNPPFSAPVFRQPKIIENIFWLLAHTSTYIE